MPTLAILQVPWPKKMGHGQSWSVDVRTISSGQTITVITIAKRVRDAVCAISKPCAATGWAVLIIHGFVSIA